MTVSRYCIKCGAPLLDGMRFCPKCGAPVAAAPVQGTGAPQQTVTTQIPQMSYPQQPVNQTGSYTAQHTTAGIVPGFPYDGYVEEDYRRPSRWPYVVLVLAIIAGILAGLYYFKPAVLNSGIDKINEIAHTEFKHIGEKEPEPSPSSSPSTVIAVTPTPEPTAAPTPTPTPAPTPTPTPTLAPTATPTPVPTDPTYFNEITGIFADFYQSYLDVYNTGRLSELKNISSDVYSFMDQRIAKNNKGYTFRNRTVSILGSSYKTKENSDGSITADFQAHFENDCWRTSDNKYYDNQPDMKVTMTYNPSDKTWQIDKLSMVIDAKYDKNDLIIVKTQ